MRYTKSRSGFETPVKFRCAGLSPSRRFHPRWLFQTQDATDAARTTSNFKRLPWQADNKERATMTAYFPKKKLDPIVPAGEDIERRAY